ncbi:MAG TPA: hypothetical protein VFT70_06650 [Nocardioides sp.]|nr:hypothetical protein [Nocardioides sp.]
MTALRPAEADLTVGPGPAVLGTGRLASDLARVFGVDAVVDHREPLPVRSHYLLLPPVPGPLRLAAASDEQLDSDLARALRDSIYALQGIASRIDAAIAPRSTGSDRDGGSAETDRSGRDSGSITIVLPAAATLGQAGASVAGAFCGGMLSLARTLAIELKRQRIRVNTVLVDQHVPGVVASLATQATALMSMPGVTGQEIYLADGLDCGRIRP